MAAGTNIQLTFTTTALQQQVKACTQYHVPSLQELIAERKAL